MDWKTLLNEAEDKAALKTHNIQQQQQQQQQQREIYPQTQIQTPSTMTTTMTMTMTTTTMMMLTLLCGTLSFACRCFLRDLDFRKFHARFRFFSFRVYAFFFVCVVRVREKKNPSILTEKSSRWWWWCNKRNSSTTPKGSRTRAREMRRRGIPVWGAFCCGILSLFLFSKLVSLSFFSLWLNSALLFPPILSCCCG